MAALVGIGFEIDSEILRRSLAASTSEERMPLLDCLLDILLFDDNVLERLLFDETEVEPTTEHGRRRQGRYQK